MGNDGQTKEEVYVESGPIRGYGDPVLRDQADTVSHVNASIRALLDEMADVMYEASGVGLAAPQIGVSKRVVVIDAGEGLIELINPEIVQRSGEAVEFEGCLSIPGFLGEVSRAASVRVQALDRRGRKLWVDGEDLLARAIQHEIDHLNGILYVDRAKRVIEVPPETQLDLVFMGSPDFGAVVLEALVQRGCRVKAVVTQPDRRRGRGMEPQPTAVKRLAEEHGLPVWQPDRVSDAETVERLKELEPDVLITAAYGKIVPPSILSLPRYGCLNVHASLLPEYRGAAPIQRVLMDGRTETGITIMQMDEGLDTGPVLRQARVEIGDSVTAGELHDQLASLGGETLLKTLRDLANEELKPKTQPEQGTYAEKIKDEDRLIHWQQPAYRIANQVRALDPQPGAYTFFEGHRVKVFGARAEAATVPSGVSAPNFDSTVLETVSEAAVSEAAVSEADETGEAGVVQAVLPDRLLINTGNGTLAISEIQWPGSRRMPVKDFLNGHPLEAGIRLGA